MATIKQWEQQDFWPEEKLVNNYVNAINKAHNYDTVDHPKHYKAHPSGVECIEITEHMGFNLGNAIKYIWRCDLKRDAIEDLKKAKWYIDREIQKRSRE